MLEYRVVWVRKLDLFRSGSREVRDVPELTNLTNEMSQDGWHVASVGESSGGNPKGLFVTFERDTYR